MIDDAASETIADALLLQPSDVTVTEYVPAVVGVPEMRPLEASIARPVGSAPELIDHVFASDTLDVICSEYGAPVVADVVDSGPTVRFGCPETTGIVNRFSPCEP